MLSLVVAMDQNNVIGYKGDMPWHLPNDLKYFKEKTTGHTIIMGRKTYESIGRPLPNRHNVVLTRKAPELPDDIQVIHSIDQIYELNASNPKEEYFIIGGGNIYKQILPFADKLYVTEIDASFNGDTHFPQIFPDEWEQVSKVKGIKDDKNKYDYYFIEYIRK